MSGRPKRYNLDYFSHDVDMRNDPKVKALRTNFGLKGYAVYLMLLEILGDADNLIIPWDNISIEIYSGDIGISGTEITETVNYCDRIGLLSIENNLLYCKTLDKRASFVFDKRGHNITRVGISVAEKGVSVAESGVSVAENTQSKVKESKVKKRDIYTPLDLKKITDVVTMMNDICGTSFRDSSLNTRKHIHARITEGYHKEDFEKVIRYKFDEWNDDSKMSQYLRPDTLFGTKFESYLIAANKEDGDGFR